MTSNNGSPREPEMPPPGQPRPAPVREPEPDRLPDEDPRPNPDENKNPPRHAEPLEPARARQGLLGKPVLLVLIGGLALAMIVWWLAEMYGVAIAP